MPHLIVFGVIVLAPIGILTLLRSDAALAFLSLCLGYVLVQFVANDAVSLVTAIFPKAGTLSESTVKIIFLWLPVVLTILATFHSVKRTRLILNLLPAIGVGLLGLLLVEPLLSPGLRGAIDNSNAWRQFQQAQTLIVGLSALISLVFLWLQRRSHQKGEGSKRHKG